jgi:hypothetical protein
MDKMGGPTGGNVLTSHSVQVIAPDYPISIIALVIQLQVSGAWRVPQLSLYNLRNLSIELLNNPITHPGAALITNSHHLPSPYTHSRPPILPLQGLP